MIYVGRRVVAVYCFRGTAFRGAPPQIIVIGYTWLIDAETGGSALHLWLGSAHTEEEEGEEGGVSRSPTGGGVLSDRITYRKAGFKIIH